MEEKLANISSGSSGNEVGEEENSSSTAGTILYSFKERFSLVPETFLFPRMTLKTLMNRWLITDVENNIPAFKYLSAKDLRHVRNGRFDLNKMTKLMGHVERCGHEKSVDFIEMGF